MGEESVLYLRFFGVDVRVTSDAPEVHHALAHIYERQRIEASPVAKADLDVTVRARASGGPHVRVRHRRVRPPCPELLLHYAHLVLVNAAAAGAEDRQILHAGSVAKDGRAIALVAPSGGGKTTMTLALVLRGWRLLSDDFAVLHSQGMVEPFVRRLNVTETTLSMLRVPLPGGALPVTTPGGGVKWMIDPERLAAGSVGEATRLRAVFLIEHDPRGPAVGDGAPAPECADARCLSPHDGAGDSAEERSACGVDVWRVQIDHVPDRLVERLAEVPGVRAASVAVAEREAPVLTLRVAKGARIVRRLEAILEAFDVAVVAISRPSPRAPETPGRPALEPLAHADAREAILPHDIGLSGRRFLRGTQIADVTAAVLRLDTMLGNLEGRVYRLWPGDLDATVTLVENAAAATRIRTSAAAVGPALPSAPVSHAERAR